MIHSKQPCGVVVNMFRKPPSSRMLRFRLEEDSLFHPAIPDPIRSGDVLLCRTEFKPHEIHCRQLVVVRLRSSNKMFCRFLCSHPTYGLTGKVLLKPLNPNSQIIMADSSDLEILGIAEHREQPEPTSERPDFETPATAASKSGGLHFWAHRRGQRLAADRRAVAEWLSDAVNSRERKIKELAGDLIAALESGDSANHIERALLDLEIERGEKADRFAGMLSTLACDPKATDNEISEKMSTVIDALMNGDEDDE